MQPQYPMYVLIFDEQSFFEAKNAKALQHFEKPDLEEGPHRAWDASGKEYVLHWEDRLAGFSGQVVPVFVSTNGVQGFADALATYAKKLHQEGMDQAPRKRCHPARLHEVLNDMLRGADAT